jgi:peptide/nickel transport system substrate-binding protein
VKRLFVPLAILIVAAFIITGCGGTTPTTTGPAVTTSATTTAPTTTVATTAPTTSATKPPASTTATTTAPTTSASSQYGGTLRVIETAAPGAPLGAEWEGNLGTYNTQQWVLERLLKEKGDGTMQGELVETWEVTSTGDTPNVVFHLRKGVKFHDGSDWNAQALAFNLKMYKDGNMFGSTTNYWKSWDIIDDYTVRVNFTQYLNTLMRAWENYFFVSPTAYTKNGIDWMRTHMVGTAGFAQTDFQRDVSMTAVRVNNYWQQGKPYLDGVKLLYVADQLTREALFKSGGAEMLNALLMEVSQFPAPDYVTITKDGGPTMLIPDSKNTDSPWANVKVRLAVDYSIDKDSMAKTFGYGFGKPAYQMSSSATKAYDPALEAKYRKYDVAKAKQLMTDAGFPNGFKTTIYMGPGLDRNPVIAIQAYLSKIGIVADLQFPEPAAWQAMTTQPAKLNSLLYWPLAEWSNYNTTLNVFFPRTNLGFYFPSLLKGDSAAAYDALVTKSLTAPVPDPVILRQISDTMFDNCSIIPLVYSTTPFILKPTVHDTGLTNFGMVNEWDYANTWMSK